jgi:hypothetical protein
VVKRNYSAAFGLGAARSLTALAASLNGEIAVHREPTTTRNLTAFAANLLVEVETVALLVGCGGLAATSSGYLP